MSGRKSVNLQWDIACLFLTAFAFSACQSPQINVKNSTLLSPHDGNSVTSAKEIVFEDQSPENPQPQIKKVIEWDTASSSSIMPPAEVRETIDENCRKIGYDRGVIVSMSLFETKVTADFDCRGEDAI